MTIADVQECLKNMSGDELAQAQNAIVLASDLEDEDRMLCMMLISQELAIRQNEGFMRKTERFLNRHGERAALIGLGALLGVSLDG